MERVNRNFTPKYLYKIIAGERLFIRKGKAWKDDYRAHGIASRFQWGKIRIAGVEHYLSQLIAEDLGLLSKDHCFYCDRKQVVRGEVRPTIDHFYPKTKVPFLAYTWENLFLSCDTCQGYKGDFFYRNHLLKFDTTNYNFSNFFYIDFATGKIRTRPDISIEDRKKARITLTVLGINRDSRHITRMNELIDFENTIPERRDLNRFSFRYYITRSLI